MANNQPTPTPVRAHVFVSGKVQGVGYRASAWDAAALLKLNGWVRNLRDGRVEAVFEGPRDRVEEVIRWCHQGPPAAIVEHVSVMYETPEALKGFQVTR
ncbi:MAG: acylphosphatase [Kaiparowitsia implicata GSE-PSE-MK54-09C]|jgi:acylphosphatase|nr:acylphosphatase [Kaiparowitsia implicata GSE-PSE-MK54-09C]